MFSQSGNFDDSTSAVDEQFDDSANCIVMGVGEGNRILSAIRIHVLDGATRESPAYHVFPDILDPALDEGFRIVDSSGFCARSDITRKGADAAYRLLAVSVYVANRLNPAKMLATARGRHDLFYRRMFGADLACEARRYPGRRHPLALYMRSASKVVDALERRNERRFFLTEPDRRIVDGAMRRFVADHGDME